MRWFTRRVSADLDGTWPDGSDGSVDMQTCCKLGASTLSCVKSASRRIEPSVARKGETEESTPVAKSAGTTATLSSALSASTPAYPSTAPERSSSVVDSAFVALEAHRTSSSGAESDVGWHAPLASPDLLVLAEYRLA